MVPSVFEPSGPAAEDIGVLWWFLLVVGTVVFLLVAVLLVVPMIRRWRTEGGDDRGGDRTDVPASTSSRWIVGLGVVMPTVLLVGVLVGHGVDDPADLGGGPGRRSADRGRGVPVLVVGPLRRRGRDGGQRDPHPCR